jgi:hypothetical protein
MKLSDVLSGPEKWHKGSYFKDKHGSSICTADESQSFCLGGAICYLIYKKNLSGHEEQEAYQQVSVEVENAIKSINNCYSLPITIWNDRPERTWEDIQKVMEIAKV